MTSLLSAPELAAPAFRRNFLGMLRAGGRLEEACKLTGIKPSTFATWRELASTDLEPFATFILQCDKAEADAILKALRAVQRHSRSDGRVALEFLKRRHSDWNRSYEQMDAAAAKKLDELDLSSGGIAAALEELDAIDNVIPLSRRKGRRKAQPGGAGEGGDGEHQRALRYGEVDQTAGGGTDGGGSRP